MKTGQFLLPIVAACLLASHVHAVEPTLRTLDIRGLRVGGTTTLTIEGDDLGKAPRLVLPFPAKQILKPGATDKKAVFDVSLSDDVEPGLHHLRIASEGGVSLPVVIGVDRMAHLPITALIAELPASLHGSVAGGSIVETKFVGKVKQRIQVEVEAQRLGSKLRPIIHLYNSRKLQLAWAWATPVLLGDARLEAVLPEDGTYFVTLHDAEYAAVAPSFFRLKLGTWSTADWVFPPVAGRGQTLKVIADGFSADVKTPNAQGYVPLTFPKQGIWSGPRPFVSVSANAEFVEAPVTGKLQEIPVGPAGVSGKLIAPFEEDRYRVAVAPGKKVKLEVFAERIGSAIDVAVVVRDEKGTQLARGEDSPGSLDPVLEYSVPEKVASIIVGVVDAQGRGHPNAIYRLVITPQSASAVGDAFALTTSLQRLSLPVGGRAVLPVIADRRGGFMGKIDLLAADSQSSVKFAGTTIPDGADGTLLTVEQTAAGVDAVITSFKGKTADGVEQIVTIKNHPLEKLQPWLASEIAIAPTTDVAAEFAVDWRDLPDATVLSPASRLLLPVKIIRPVGKTTVKLTLLTSQNTPLLNNVPDPIKAIRQDKTGEIAAGVSTGDVTAIVPAELTSPVYDVTVQAELLDPAKKVLATAYAPVRRMPVVLPIAVKLDGPNRVETAFDAKKGATLKLQGKLERREGLKVDVLLAIAGLPVGAKTEAMTVKADASTFTINVTFPPTVPSGEISGVKLSGSYVPDAKQPNARVRSRDVDLTIVLKAMP